MQNSEIQNLRAIGIILVLMGHMPFSIPNILVHGYSFVNLFLMISGYFFVISYSKNENTKRLFLKQLISRAFRLLPLMWGWIFIYFFIGNIVIYWGGNMVI